MLKKNCLLFVLLLSFGFAESLQAADVAKPAAKKQPNILFILIDDLGWKDVGYNGSKLYETPNIDRLAKQGMVFSSGYASSPQCSSTRASLQTGKYPARLGLTYWIGGHQVREVLISAPSILNLPPKEVTIGEALQQGGYETYFIGKWHLGNKSHPSKEGYKYVDAYSPSNVGRYFWKQYSKKVPSLKKGGKPGDFLTDHLTRNACQLLSQAANKKKPFIMFVSTYAVHTRLDCKEDYRKKYEKKIAKLPPIVGPKYVNESGYARFPHNPIIQGQQNPTYAGMIQSVDENVGRLLKKLDDLKLTDNTLVVFTSDNGGLSSRKYRRIHMKDVKVPWEQGSYPTSNAPLRCGKSWIFEGGIRVPTIIKWPKKIQPGSRCDVPITSVDFFPTFLQAAKLPLRPKDHMDGESIIPLLVGNKKSFKRDTIYFHYPHYEEALGTFPGSAIRSGKWKLIHWYEGNRIELYDLDKDIGEKTNLAKQQPKRTAEMLKKLNAWRKEVKAIAPQPNPKLQPASFKQLSSKQ